jgi:hypothetical protein
VVQQYRQDRDGAHAIESRQVIDSAGCSVHR